MAKNIITLRNAVSDLDILLDTFVRVRNIIQDSLFDLNGLVDIGVTEGLMSSKGRKGIEARLRSYNDNQSLDSMPMQFKAYAEMYRLLGWLRSESNNKRTQYRITFLGHLISKLEAPIPLMEQCFLGIDLPTGSVERECINKSRILWCYLRAIKQAGFALKKEHFLYICHTILDDENDDDFQRKVQDVIDFEKQDHKLILEKIKEIALSANLQPNTLGNSTRLTISALKRFGWTSNKKNYFSLTEYGNDLVNKYDLYFRPTYIDIQKKYKEYVYEISVVGLIHLLERANVDSSETKKILDYETSLELLIANNIIAREQEILFSPYQVLDPDTLKNIFEDKLDFYSDNKYSSSNTLHPKVPTDQIISTSIVLKDHFTDINSINNEGLLFNEINKRTLEGKTIEEIVNDLYIKYSNEKKDTFYEMVAESFRILGFKCIAERHGQNSIRWDAIIIDSVNSIPIEIKSPAEETIISVKAIRQAIENRVILTARQTYKTNLDVSSFVVGYNYPSLRSEVYDLISYINELYGIKIAIFSFKELLQMVTSKMINGNSADLNKFYSLIGRVHSYEN